MNIVSNATLTSFEKQMSEAKANGETLRQIRERFEGMGYKVSFKVAAGRFLFVYNQQNQLLWTYRVK